MSAWYRSVRPSAQGSRYRWGTYLRRPPPGSGLSEVMSVGGEWRACCADVAAAAADRGCVFVVCGCGQSVAVWSPGGGCDDPGVCEVWADDA